MEEESKLKFPKAAEKPRLQGYEHYNEIYYGDHYSAYAIKGQKDFAERYKRLRYIVANFGALSSKVMADMLFGENLSIDFDNKSNQEFSDKVFEDNSLITQLHESALGNSRRGDAVFKMRIGQRNPAVVDSTNSIIIEEFTPAIYFPELSHTDTRNTPTKDVIAVVFDRDGKCYLHVETHEPGTIRHQVYEYDKDKQEIINEVNAADFGYAEEEKTGINRSLVFHVPNVRDSGGFWGTSDYLDLDSLFFALNNRITKIDNILDKHSDPILAVPPGVIDENGKVKKEALGMFEVDSESPGFNKPEYVVWNANLESAFNQVDKLLEMLFMFSEIAPSSMGMDKGGQAESGRALKFKLLATIRKRNRKMRYYDQAIKDMLETAQELALSNGTVDYEGIKISEPERPKIKWSDGIINDEVEQTEVVTARIDNGTMSPADGLVYLDGITPEEAKEKAKEIEDETKSPIPPVLSGFVGTQPPDDEDDPTKPKPPKPAKKPAVAAEV